MADSYIITFKSPTCSKSARLEDMPLAKYEVYYDACHLLTDAKDRQFAISCVMESIHNIGGDFMTQDANCPNTVHIDKRAAAIFLSENAKSFVNDAGDLEAKHLFSTYRSWALHIVNMNLNGDRYGDHFRYAPAGDCTDTDFARFIATGDCPDLLYIDAVYAFRRED